ncbi:cytochrome P450 [Marasmius fiardii PR-910]|nr:cytochrome P450 [Marasmius fiardii PR-910]
MLSHSFDSFAITSPLIKGISVATLGFALFNLFKFASHYLRTAHLQSVPYRGFLLGNFADALDDDRGAIHNRWFERYGKVFRVWDVFGAIDVMMADLKGVSHVLQNPEIYEKPDVTRYMLSRITGHGVLVTEGDKHKKQRKVMNPAFGPSQIRALTDIFIEKSIELRDIWISHIEKDGSTAQVDVVPWLSRMTLDVIGLAGFDYQFSALSGKPNELNKAFSHIFSPGNPLTPYLMLKLLLPPLRSLPEVDTTFRQAQSTTSRIARDLLRQRKNTTSEKSGNRDLLSLLVRSNIDTDLPDNQRMSDDEVLAQVPTFLAAGHETTSTSTTWAIYLLSMYPQTQIRLREELLSAVPTDTPSMEQLNALPYLDAVVRETLRLLAPVPATQRMAMKDDVIPLDEPFIDRYGRKHAVLEVKKGQQIQIPILGINRDKTLWGEDAEEFKPDRWQNLPESVNGIPGVWGNIMTFLGGSHACIGWRFSLVEMKALLFTLIRAFEFELVVPKEDLLIKRGSVVNRPALRGREDESQLPVRIRLVGS